MTNIHAAGSLGLHLPATAADRTVLRAWGLQADTADIARGLRLPGTEHADATLALDGTPGKITGSYWADVSAIKMPSPGVLVMQLVDDGKPALLALRPLGSR